jgi:hypothetical protein
MVKILKIQSNVHAGSVWVFRLVLNLHYADILKSKSWLSKDILDLQIKPKPINWNRIETFHNRALPKNIRNMTYKTLELRHTKWF